MKRLSFFVALTIVYGCGCPCDAQTVEARKGKGPPALEWFNSTQGAAVDVLYYGDRLVGMWDHETRKYRAMFYDQWGPECEPPIPPRNPPAELIKRGENFGVDIDKLKAKSYSISGVPSTREQVIEAIDADIPDDAKKPRVTVMGAQKAREAMVLALREMFTRNKLDDKVLLGSGAADDVILKRRGFVCPCELITYVQDPSGKQLAAIKSATPAEVVPEVETTLRAHDESLFPGGGGGGGGGSSKWPLTDMQTLAAVIGLAAGLYYMKK